ncbi:MAG: hypothetical protein KGN84_01505 [Acidobacteriota bacterium]|nr:hypothetical protein [Acidobacteriota bacterium]
MEGFADVAKARATFKVFAEAVSAGREIMRRAGVADPPEIPSFDAVFRRLSPESKQELYAAIAEKEELGPADAIRIWTPFIRRAFGAPARP